MKALPQKDREHFFSTTTKKMQQTNFSEYKSPLNMRQPLQPKWQYSRFALVKLSLFNKTVFQHHFVTFVYFIAQLARDRNALFLVKVMFRYQSFMFLFFLPPAHFVLMNICRSSCLLHFIIIVNYLLNFFWKREWDLIDILKDRAVL